MKAKIQKLGDDYVMVLPQTIIEELGLSEGSEVEISVEGETLSLSSVPRYRLEDLVSQITDENKHGEIW